MVPIRYLFDSAATHAVITEAVTRLNLSRHQTDVSVTYVPIKLCDGITGNYHWYIKCLVIKHVGFVIPSASFSTSKG